MTDTTTAMTTPEELVKRLDKLALQLPYTHDREACEQAAALLRDLEKRLADAEAKARLFSRNAWDAEMMVRAATVRAEQAEAALGGARAKVAAITDKAHGLLIATRFMGDLTAPRQALLSALTSDGSAAKESR